MSEKLICHKCKNGLYHYTEPDRDDWENREMTCDNCGNKDTLRKQTERFFASVVGSKAGKMMDYKKAELKEKIRKTIQSTPWSKNTDSHFDVEVPEHILEKVIIPYCENMERENAALRAKLEKTSNALSSYVSVCGNTAAIVDRIALGIAYDMAIAALADIKEES